MAKSDTGNYRDSGPIPLKVVLLLGGLVAIGPLSIDMYLPAFAEIAKSLGTGIGDVQITLSVFLGGIAVGQAFYGPVADRYGRKRPLLFGLTLYVLGTAGCAMAASLNSLTFWRLVAALGGAGGMVVARSVVRDCCNTTEMAKMFSLLMLIMGAAPILAPSLGGILLTFTGWEMLFVVLFLFGCACLLASILFLGETLPPHKRSQGGLGIALVRYLRLLTDKWFCVHVLIIGGTSGMLFSYISEAPSIFVELHAISPQAFSVYFGINAAALIGVSQLNRFLLSYWHPRTLMIAGNGVALSASVILFLLAFLRWDSFLSTELCLFFLLGSAGLIFPNAAALIMEPFASVAGSAGALQGTIQFSLGAGAGGLLSLLHDGSSLPMSGLILVFCLISTILAVVSLYLKIDYNKFTRDS